MESGGSIVNGRVISEKCNERNMSSSVYCFAKNKIGSDQPEASGKPLIYFLLLLMLFLVKKVKIRKVSTTYEKPTPTLLMYFSSTFFITALLFYTYWTCSMLVS
jgi:hypothetical protein